MDHEIQNDVDIEGTRREDAEAMRLEEHGLIERCEGSGDRRIEALKMADRDYATMCLRERKEVVRLGKVRSKRLFNEDVETCE